MSDYFLVVTRADLNEYSNHKIYINICVCVCKFKYTSAKRSAQKEVNSGPLGFISHLARRAKGISRHAPLISTNQDAARAQGALVRHQRQEMHR